MSKRRRDEESPLVVSFRVEGEGITRNSIYRGMQKYGRVQKCSFVDGDTVGYVEYSNMDDAAKAITAIQDGIAKVNNCDIHLIEPTEDMKHESRQREFHQVPRRKVPTTPMFQNLLKIMQSKATRQIPDGSVFRLTCCNPRSHWFLKNHSKTPRQEHRIYDQSCNLKLHYLELMSSHIVGESLKKKKKKKESDVEEKEKKFMYHTEMDYLHDQLTSCYPNLDKPGPSFVFPFVKEEYDKHLRRQKVIGRREALHLMVIDEKLGLNNLIPDLHNAAEEFARKEKIPCEKVAGSNLGQLRMRADDLRELVRGVLGPTSFPVIAVKDCERSKCVHEISVYIDGAGDLVLPTKSEKTVLNCLPGDLITF